MSDVTTLEMTSYSAAMNGSQVAQLWSVAKVVNEPGFCGPGTRFCTVAALLVNAGHAGSDVTGMFGLPDTMKLPQYVFISCANCWSFALS
jgi:hypothetical protein